MPGFWSDYNLKHSIGKLGLLKKRGYLHFFRDIKSDSRDITLDEVVIPGKEPSFRVKMVRQDDGNWSPDNSSSELAQKKIDRFKLELASTANNPFIDGWFFYSQSEMSLFASTFPDVSLAFRSPLNELSDDKLAYLDDFLCKAQALLKESGAPATFVCSETGKEIT